MSVNAFGKHIIQTGHQRPATTVTTPPQAGDERSRAGGGKKRGRVPVASRPKFQPGRQEVKDNE